MIHTAARNGIPSSMDSSRKSGSYMCMYQNLLGFLVLLMITGAEDLEIHLLRVSYWFLECIISSSEERERENVTIKINNDIFSKSNNQKRFLDIETCYYATFRAWGISANRGNKYKRHIKAFFRNFGFKCCWCYHASIYTAVDPLIKSNQKKTIKHSASGLISKSNGNQF